MSKISSVELPQSVQLESNDDVLLETCDTPKPYILKNENIFEFCFKIILIFLKLAPALLGIFDVITDITYYLTQPFAHPSIKNVFYATLLFTPIALFVTWDLQFSKQMYDSRDKNDYYRRYKEYYSIQSEVRKLKKNKLIKSKIVHIKEIFFLETKAFLFLLQIYSYDFFLLHVYMVQVSLRAIMYAVLQETKTLPFIIGFFDPTLSKVKFPITKPLVAEFQARNHLFKQQNEIKKKNNQIQSDNMNSGNFNEKQKLTFSEIRKPIKKLLPMPEIYCTHPLQAAQIMNSDKSWNNTLLTDPYVTNFLEISQLIKAVFQSLPMLVIQYINNSQLNIWDGQLNILSFTLSVIMVVISSIKMIYSISSAETSQLMEFKSYVQNDIKERSQDPLWLLQLNIDEEFYIYDMETLRIAAFANVGFYKSIKGIRFDISSDPDFIIKCLEGPTFPFECLSNIILNMNSQNEFHIQLSDNKEITLEHMKILFDALQFSNLQKITIEARTMTLDHRQLRKLVTRFISICQNKKIPLQFIGDTIQFDNMINPEIQLYINESKGISLSEGRQYNIQSAQLLIPLSNSEQLFYKTNQYDQQDIVLESIQAENYKSSVTTSGHNPQKTELHTLNNQQIPSVLSYTLDVDEVELFQVQEDDGQFKQTNIGQMLYLNSQSVELGTKQFPDKLEHRSIFQRKDNSVILEQDENDLEGDRPQSNIVTLLTDRRDGQQEHQSLYNQQSYENQSPDPNYQKHIERKINNGYDG